MRCQQQDPTSNIYLCTSESTWFYILRSISIGRQNSFYLCAAKLLLVFPIFLLSIFIHNDISKYFVLCLSFCVTVEALLCLANNLLWFIARFPNENLSSALKVLYNISEFLCVDVFTTGTVIYIIINLYILKKREETCKYLIIAIFQLQVFVISLSYLVLYFLIGYGSKDVVPEIGGILFNTIVILLTGFVIVMSIYYLIKYKPNHSYERRTRRRIFNAYGIVVISLILCAASILRSHPDYYELVQIVEKTFAFVALPLAVICSPCYRKQLRRFFLRCCSHRPSKPPKIVKDNDSTCSVSSTSSKKELVGPVSAFYSYLEPAPKQQRIRSAPAFTRTNPNPSNFSKNRPNPMFVIPQNAHCVVVPLANIAATHARMPFYIS